MGFISYEHSQIIKNQLDMKGNRVQKIAFNIPLSEDVFVRDCNLTASGNIAVINSSKQLILQEPDQGQNGLHNEMMDFYV